ncbi:hypothetical protein D6783_04885 [Candidatus Woesearchaeota archaeon]|nr:MAG: hypothetical protein D6783_04885 [Candidatus Woesearchaeota archaeon]
MSIATRPTSKEGNGLDFVFGRSANQSKTSGKSKQSAERELATSKKSEGRNAANTAAKTDARKFLVSVRAAKKDKGMHKATNVWAVIFAAIPKGRNNPPSAIIKAKSGDPTTLLPPHPSSSYKGGRP